VVSPAALHNRVANVASPAQDGEGGRSAGGAAERDKVMKAVVQRVHSAEVSSHEEVVGRIDAGMLVSVAVAEGDGAEDAERLAGIRIFEAGEGRLNRDVRDVRGNVPATPDFTLVADTRKGRRPSFVEAARPESAKPLYDTFIAALRDRECTGAFGRRWPSVPRRPGR